MSYVGNTNTTQGFTPAVDYFSGNGSTVAFTLSRPVASTAQVQVVVNNVAQNPTDAFTVLNNTITFTSAPSIGTNNVYVQYTSPINQVIQPGQGTVGAVQLDIAGGAGTGAAKMPVGTTAQRPSGPTSGMYRMNSTTNEPEWYDSVNGLWVQFSEHQAIPATYLVVGGGGGGGTIYYGGGGGAGGMTEGTQNMIVGTSYTVTVGAGGGGNTNGSSSVFGPVTGFGGGGGLPTGAGTSGSGGSSGGGGSVTGTAVSGQGNLGTVATGSSGGGGGGAGGAGLAATAGAPQSGGAGRASTITGSSVTYAGGGGGGMNANASYFVALGGSGGGGNAAADYSGGVVQAQAGTANRGGGGGGACWNNTTAAGSGGSGVVILRYPSTRSLTIAAGLTSSTTTSGSFKITTFTAGTGAVTIA